MCYRLIHKQHLYAHSLKIIMLVVVLKRVNHKNRGLTTKNLKSMKDLKTNYNYCTMPVSMARLRVNGQALL